MEKKIEKTETFSEKYSLGEVATQTEPIIIDNETKEQYSVHIALTKILNDLEEIKQNIVPIEN